VSDSVSRRLSALNNDLVVVLGRFDEALAMLRDWANEHPEDEALVRMTNNFLKRCEDPR
jgi:hypothetical protein